jgi:hypothetical protein
MTRVAFPGATPCQGWAAVVAEGRQLHRRFRDEHGSYTYGLGELSARTPQDLVDELLDVDPQSTVSFAIIGAPAADWEPRQTAAFRHDLDFYVFTELTSRAIAALQAYLSEPATVLCFTTSLSFDALVSA